MNRARIRGAAPARGRFGGTWVRAVVVLAGLAALGTAPAPGATYGIDPTHTFVHFEVAHFNTSISRGRWSRKSGTIEFDREARTGRAEIAIAMASVSTGVPAFDERLKGPEFFDVAAHPDARFVGERFVFDGDRVVAVHGTLTLRGRTHELTLQAQRFDCYTSPLFKREVCGGDFEAEVSRSRYGLAALPALEADRVRLLIQVEAIRQ